MHNKQIQPISRKPNALAKSKKQPHRADYWTGHSSETDPPKVLLFNWLFYKGRIHFPEQQQQSTEVH